MAERHPYYNPDADLLELKAFSNRLVQYMGPTPMAAAHPDSVPFKMAMKRQGRRDELIRSLDPEQMTPEGRASLVGHLLHTGRLEQALAAYPNLAALGNLPDDERTLAEFDDWAQQFALGTDPDDE